MLKRVCLVFLSVILLSQSVFAAGLYKDVPVDDVDAAAFEYVTARKYMCGYPDGTFRREQAVTLKQLCVVLGRVFNLAPGDDAVRWAVNRTYVNSNIVPDEVLYGRVKPDEAISIIGRAFGILPTQAVSVTYPVYSDSDAAGYMRNAGLSLGVFDIRVDDVLGRDFLSRGDLAYLVYRMCRYREAHPGDFNYGWGYVNVSVDGPYEYLRTDAWDDILILPWPIVKHFHDAGYRIVCGEAGISRLGLHDNSVVGVFSPVDKAIFVQQIDGVIHAMGHYVSSFMVGLAEADAAFPRERLAAGEYVDPNAASGSDEFFAECFNYYVRAKNARNYASMAMMSERMPEIWAFITNMDVLNWCAAAKYVPAEVVGTGVFPVDCVVHSVYCRHF